MLLIISGITHSKIEITPDLALIVQGTRSLLGGLCGECFEIHHKYRI